MLRSIRVKLTLWYICILALVFSAFAAVTYTLIVRALRDEMRTNISEMANDLITALNQARNDKHSRSTPENLINEVLSEFNFRDYRFAVFDQQDRLVGKTLDQDPTVVIGNVRDQNNFARIDITHETFSVLERSIQLGGKSFRLYVFFSVEDQELTQKRIRNIFFVGAPIMLLLAGFGGYFLARQSLRPIALMGERAKQIGAENLHERLPVKNRNDEIGNLAVLFNQLLDRLDHEFERQRRFMADASHELRTPLAIVRGESEVALQNDHRSVGEYQESLRIVNDEGKRLTKIVDDLFTLARADGGDASVNFGQVHLDEVIEDCVTSIRTLAEKAKVQLSFECEPTMIRGDESLLRRLFLNLLDNAVKYNFPGGQVRVTAEANRIEVRNTGPEIPEDQQGLIFERFYRIDKAYSRRTETITSGAGLGLAISKWIAEIHNAELSISRSDNDENIFSILFRR